MRAQLLFALSCGAAATLAAQTATPPQPPPGAFHPPARAAVQAPGTRPGPARPESAPPPAPQPLEAWRFNARERTARGLAAWRNEQPAEAVAAFDTAARLQPGDPLAAYNSGTGHLAAGLADAGPILERAVRDAPAELATDAHYNLGNSRLAARDAAGAIDSFKETLRRAPGHAGARRNLELALRLLEEQQNRPQQNPPQDGSSEQDPQQQPQGQPKPDSGENGEGEGDPGESDESRQPPGAPQQQPSGSGSQRERPLPQFQDQQDMTAEQAAAILQAVDNLEREKRRDDAKQRALAKKTVEKDW